LTPQIRFKKEYLLRCEKESKINYIITRVLKRILNGEKITTIRLKRKRITKFEIIQGSRFKPIKSGIFIYIKKIERFSLYELMNEFSNDIGRNIVINDLGFSQKELYEIEIEKKMNLTKCFCFSLFKMNPKIKISYEKFIRKPLYLHHFDVWEDCSKNTRSLEEFFGA